MLMEVAQVAENKGNHAVSLIGEEVKPGWRCGRWQCEHQNTADVNVCAKCKYSRKKTWAGVLHDRGCNPFRCTCEASR